MKISKINNIKINKDVINTNNNKDMIEEIIKYMRKRYIYRGDKIMSNPFVEDEDLYFYFLLGSLPNDIIFKEIFKYL